MLIQHNDRIVFCGDSVTEMGSTNPVGEGYPDTLGLGYVRMIDTLLAAWYPERDIRVTNSGIGGNTSRNLLERYQRDVVDLKPDWVSICVGINDAWRRIDMPAFPEWAVLPDEYERNLESMVQQVKDSVKGVFIMSPFIIDSNREDMLRVCLNDYIAIAEKVAKKYGCVYINLQEVFEKHCNIRHTSRWAGDRIHPYLSASTLIARAFLKRVGFDFNKED